MSGRELTLKQVMTSLNPDWERVEDWLSWPPDLFLLTSSVLKSTGTYRYVVSPPCEWPDKPDWSDVVIREAKEWREWMVCPERKLPPLLAAGKEVIEKYWDSVSIASLRSIRSSDLAGSDDGSWNLCRTLLEMHAVADEACRGFGLPSGSYSRMNPPFRSEMSAIDYLANLLLVTTGSLSRLPRSQGVVLPKMRTPQVGLTLRSLSHHLTYHQSEVEVIWRTMPWVNIDENTINVLVVPWPTDVKVTWFRPEHHFVKRKSSESTRYFAYVRGENALRIEKVIALLDQAEESVKRVHMIVFPELSLTARELDELKNRLAKRSMRDCMPMIVAGLCEEPGTDKKSVSLGYNRVVLSTFFAGKWYDLFQNKHHRWKLDGHQIQQYNLGGVLTGSKDWWEAIKLPERRLTFMAPNGWLTLCPLICEDLARLEPISDLIRGVGPTLLIAILLDGPQLRERWPGRYASVLADDPGTSVLTVSSLGMARRSEPQMREKLDDHVALWKDQVKGWRDIKLKDGEDAVVVIVTASWYEELTADGRGDQKAAAVFAIQGTAGLSSEKEAPDKKQVSEEWEPAAYETSESTDTDDISEMTTFAYLVDAALDSTNEVVENLGRWAVGEHSEKDWLASKFRSKDAVLRMIVERKVTLTREFKVLVGWFADLLKRVPVVEDERGNLTPYWYDLVDEAEKVLENARQDAFHKNIDKGDSLDAALKKGTFPVHEALRVQIYSALSLLWAVHRRLSRERREIGLTSTTARLLYKVESLLPGKYDKEWYKAKEAYRAPEGRELKV